MVAYALYKRHKREWARGILKETGTDPTPAQDAEFARALSTDSSLDRLRQDANGMLVAFANQVLDDERPYIEEEAIPKRVDAAIRSLESSNSFFRQVASGTLSSIITIAVLVLLTLSIGLFGIDVVDEHSLLHKSQETAVDSAKAD